MANLYHNNFTIYGEIKDLKNFKNWFNNEGIYLLPRYESVSLDSTSYSLIYSIRTLWKSLRKFLYNVIIEFPHLLFNLHYFSYDDFIDGQIIIKGDFTYLDLVLPIPAQLFDHNIKNFDAFRLSVNSIYGKSLEIAKSRISIFKKQS